MYCTEHVVPDMKYALESVWRDWKCYDNIDLSLWRKESCGWCNNGLEIFVLLIEASTWCLQDLCSSTSRKDHSFNICRVWREYTPEASWLCQGNVLDGNKYVRETSCQEWATTGGIILPCWYCIVLSGYKCGVCSNSHLSSRQVKLIVALSRRWRRMKVQGWRREVTCSCCW